MPERGELTVLCLHEAGTTGAIWQALSEALADHATVLAPDRPGWGENPAPEGYSRTTVTEQAGFAAHDPPRARTRRRLRLGHRRGRGHRALARRAEPGRRNGPDRAAASLVRSRGHRAAHRRCRRGPRRGGGGGQGGRARRLPRRPATRPGAWRRPHSEGPRRPRRSGRVQPCLPSCPRCRHGSAPTPSSRPRRSHP